jgi:hypothetical protein
VAVHSSRRSGNIQDPLGGDNCILRNRRPMASHFLLNGSTAHVPHSTEPSSLHACSQETTKTGLTSDRNRKSAQLELSSEIV